MRQRLPSLRSTKSIQCSASSTGTTCSTRLCLAGEERGRGFALFLSQALQREQVAIHAQALATQLHAMGLRLHGLLERLNL